MLNSHQSGSSTNNINYDQIPAYKGWSINTQLINGKLWVRWQHPQECFPRYGCPVNSAGIAATINHVRFLIDLSIKLELEAPVKAVPEPEFAGFLWT